VQDVCVACAASLAVRGAGVSLVSGNPGQRLVPVHVVGELGRGLLEAELTSGDGPCVDAVSGGAPVLVDDLNGREHQARWPLFTALMGDGRVRAVFAFPLLAGRVSVGVLVLCHDSTHVLSDADQSRAAQFAGALLALLLDLISCNGDGEVLEVEALALGPEIHQASGIVAIQLDCQVDEALMRLRAYALAADKPLTQVARQVVEHTVRFAPEEV
jgi:hypothetical protein